MKSFLGTGQCENKANAENNYILKFPSPCVAGKFYFITFSSDMLKYINFRSLGPLFSSEKIRGRMFTGAFGTG